MESLYEMLDFIKQYGEKQHISVKSLNQIILATEEALVNIISYGYPAKKRGVIDIVCKRHYPEAGITIVIKDQGIAFNPIEQAPPLPPLSSSKLDIEEISLGGYGIHILTGLMDKVEYERLDDGNILSLTKYSYSSWKLEYQYEYAADKFGARDCKNIYFSRQMELYKKFISPFRWQDL